MHSTPGEKEEAIAPPGDPASTEAALPQGAGWFKTFLNFRPIRIFSYREFRLLWLGQASMGMATWMDQVARGWLIYELTNSAVHLGMVRGVQALPILLLAPFAGTAADRYDRKMQVMIAQVVDGSMYAILAVLIMAGLVQPWHVYLTGFVKAVVQTFQHPARASMLADSVPLSHLTNAIGLNSVVFNVSRSTGPALAGILIAAFGTGGSYAVQTAFYVVATASTIPLRIGGRAGADSHGRGRHQTTVLRSIVEGWRYSWANESVRAGLLITLFSSLFIIPFTTVLPVFARDILGVGATGQGLLLTAMGVGALCSAVVIASLGEQLPRGVLMLVGVTLYGLSVVAFSTSRWFNLSMVLMVLVGLFHVSSHALAQTVVQAYSTSEFRGRTMSLFQQGHFVLTTGGMVVGALTSILGAQWAVALMATAGALSIVGISLLQPRTRLIH